MATKTFRVPTKIFRVPTNVLGVDRSAKPTSRRGPKAHSMMGGKTSDCVLSVKILSTIIWYKRSFIRQPPGDLLSADGTSKNDVKENVVIGQIPN